MVFKDSTDAFRKLVRSLDGSVVSTRSSAALQTLPNGLPYYFAEIIEKNGCKYCIESYGDEAIDLHREVVNYSREKLRDLI